MTDFPESVFCFSRIERLFFILLSPQNQAVYAFQLHPVCDISPDSVFALLVRFRPLHQQVGAPTKTSECLRGGGELCFLRMVGLEVSFAYSLYLVLLMGQWFAHRKGENKKGGKDMDNGQYRLKSWNPCLVQVL